MSLYDLSLYDMFNVLEGAFWWGVAIFLTTRVQTRVVRQRRALWIAAIAFICFGVSDWLEVGTAGQFPLALWGGKVLCGAAVFVSRYEWRGWQSLRWHDREVLFSVACLAGVVLVIALQKWVQSPPDGPAPA